jgi:hypothetical protein
MSSNANILSLHNNTVYFYGANLITLISGLVIDPPIKPIDPPIEPPKTPPIKPIEPPVEMPVDPPISQ